MANYRRVARQAAIRYGIDPHVFVKQIQLESGFNPGAKSPAGAIGIAQFMPGTARSEGVNPRNPRQALKGAARLDAKLIHQTGSYRKALAAYNAGPGNIQAGLGYADQILGGHVPAGKPNPGGAQTRTVPGVDRSGERKQILARYLLAQNGVGVQGSDPLDPTSQAATSGTDLTSALLKIAQTRDTPAKTVKVKGAAMNTSVKGTANFEGVRVAAWIKPELVYARRHGWKGKVTSGFRSFADQQRIYNSGVRPAAKPGTSNHEGANFPRGAVDVSNAQQLSQILQRKGSPLKYAGAKDNVHFSHPHNGSY